MIINNQKLLAAVAGTALAVSPAGIALAQGLPPWQNMTPEQLENMRQQFQAVREKFQSMEPEQQQQLMQLLQSQREEFQNLNPTAENIVVVIYNLLRPLIARENDLQIRLYETERNFVEYPV